MPDFWTEPLIFRMRGNPLTNPATSPKNVATLDRRWATVRQPVGWALGVLALYLAGRDADWGAVRQGLKGLDVLLTVAAIILALIVVYAKSERWSILVRSAVASTGQKDQRLDRLGGISLLPVVLIGQLVNNGLPFRVGELVRIESLAVRGVARLIGASTVVVEKLCDGVALVLFSAILSFVVPLPPWLNRNGILVGIGSAVILISGALTIRRILGFISRRTDRVERIVAAVTTSLIAIRSPAIAGRVMAWTLVSWIIGFLVNYAALLACGITPTAGMILLVTVAGYVGAVLPAPPGRFGVFQAICIAAVKAFGVGSTPAFVFAIVEYVAVVVAPSVVGGVCLLWTAFGRGDARTQGNGQS